MHLVHPCDWSLLPSTVFDALTCAFAAHVSHHMCLSTLEKPGSAAHYSTSTTSAGLLHILVGALVHFVWQELQANAHGCHHPSMSARHHICARLRGSKIFPTFNLRSGYHHMELCPEARAKSIFVTPMDKFEFTRCPFGLSQAPAYFQRLINEVIKGLPFAFGYLDDVLIHRPDIETHLQHMRILFQRLREADLKLKDSKCNYFKTYVQYLGHLVSGKGMKPLPEKLESVKRMPAPTTPKEIKQFLGLVGYYRKFIPRFADIARPMTNLTKQDVPFEWTIQCQAFEILKEALITSPILKYPDPNKAFTLFTDASKYAWACVLTQEYQHERMERCLKSTIPSHLLVDYLREVN